MMTANVMDFWCENWGLRSHLNVTEDLEICWKLNVESKSILINKQSLKHSNQNFIKIITDYISKDLLDTNLDFILNTNNSSTFVTWSLVTDSICKLAIFAKHNHVLCSNCYLSEFRVSTFTILPVMLSNLTVVRLGGISIVGGIVAIFCAKAETKIKSNQWEQQPYCQESLKLLKNHEGANYILGQEFTVKVY